MIQRLVFIWVVWCACAISTVKAESVTFATEQIEAIYQELPKSADGNVVDSIDLFKLRVTKSDDVISDLGVCIDQLEYLSLQIKSFVERKMLELLLAKNTEEVKRALDHSKCRLLYNGADYHNGPFWNLSDGVKVLQNSTEIASRNDDKYYYLDVKDAKNTLSIIFPANIQIVMGKNKMELEMAFEDLLCFDYDVDIYKRPETNNKFSPIDELYVNTKNFLYDEAINDVTYYSFNGVGYEPIFSFEYAVESFTNLFHFANEYTGRIDLDIRHRLYGNKTNEFTVSLDKLITYCQVNGMDVYVGIEGRDGNMLESTILLDNKKLKYLHVLHVKSDISTLFKTTKMVDSRGKMLVNLYTYVPTDNIENLFGDDNYKRRYDKFEILNRQK